MRYPKEFIEKVIESTDIVDLLSQFTQLKSAGSNMMGRCPFPDHDDKTASFSVSEPKQVYLCFGCRKSGNVITFLRDYHGMAFPEAIEFLAGRAGIPLPQKDETSPESSREEARAKEERSQLLSLNEKALEFFQQSLQKLPASDPVHAYVQKRGLSPEIIREFKIGYAPDSWDALSHYLQKGSYSSDTLASSGLIKARSQGRSGYFDLYRHRLIFPIVTNLGQVLGFGGRALGDDPPKYINSPETVTFQKSKTLYGLSQTGRYIRSQDQALVVEGYMDVVGLYQAGFKNAVAPMGTALTAEQARILRRMTRNILVMFDGDAAGQAAAEASLPVLLEAETLPKALILPNKMDPDEFILAEGAERLSQLIASAPDLFSLIRQQWMRNYHRTASEKVALADRFRPIFAVIRDSRLRSLYLTELAQEMSVERSWLAQALQSNSSDKNYSRSVPMNRPAEKASSNSPESLPGVSDSKGASDLAQIRIADASKLEVYVLALSLRSADQLKTLAEAEVLNSLTHTGIRKILLRIQELAGQYQGRFDSLTSLLVSYVDRPEIITQALAEISDLSKEAEEKLLVDTIKKVKLGALEARLRTLSIEIKAQPSPEKMSEFMEIQRQRSSLAKGL